MAVQITSIDGVVHIALTSVVTNVDLEQIASEAQTYEAGPVIPHRLTDMSEALGLNLTFESIWMLAVRRRLLRFPNNFKSAIVAPLPSQMGFARMFQTLNDNPQINIQIFPDKPTALKWIAGS